MEKISKWNGQKVYVNEHRLQHGKLDGFNCVDAAEVTIIHGNIRVIEISQQGGCVAAKRYQ
jgi:hypothetical protein